MEHFNANDGHLIKCTECGSMVELSDTSNVYDTNCCLVGCVCEHCYDSVAIRVTAIDENCDLKGGHYDD